MSERKVFNADMAHTNIGFAVKHMMFSKVRGKFDDYKATVEIAGEDFENAKLRLEADVKSVNTNNDDRDNHLRSADFFNADETAGLVFESTKITNKGDNEYVVEGDLTMNGITKNVALETMFSGRMKDPWGAERIALVMKGKVNREDWNMVYNAALETGGVLVGKNVDLDVEGEFL